MQSSKQPDFHEVINEIANAIEASSALNKHSRILHNVYSKWPAALLALLLKQQIITKEKSKRLETIQCFCGAGELLQVEYEGQKKSPFAQCFACTDMRPIEPVRLEYYHATPLSIAQFITRCLDDIDEPMVLVRDRAFFAGQTDNGVLIYFVCGFKNGNIQELLNACGKHAAAQSFLILTAHIPNDIPKKYTLLSVADKKLYALSDDSIALDATFFDSFFAKRNINQEAVNARWAAKKKAEQKLTQYVESNINGWPHLNHAQIAQHIYKHNNGLLKYKNKCGGDEFLSKSQVREVVKAFFIATGEESRIFGLTLYNSDD